MPDGAAPPSRPSDAAAELRRLRAIDGRDVARLALVNVGGKALKAARRRKAEADRRVEQAQGEHDLVLAADDGAGRLATLLRLLRARLPRGRALRTQLAEALSEAHAARAALADLTRRIRADDRYRSECLRLASNLRRRVRALEEAERAAGPARTQPRPRAAPAPIRPSPNLPRAASVPEPRRGPSVAPPGMLPDPGPYPPVLLSRRPLPAGGLPCLEGNYSLGKGVVYLPIGPEHEAQAIALGATKGARGGVSVPARGDLSRFGDLLPLFARPFLDPIVPDMIPVTSWGSSLANLLTLTSWQAVKNPIIDDVGRLCVVCGENKGSARPDAHEIWEYHPPATRGRPGVQRLAAIWPLCNPCHSFFHLGLASAQGRLERSLGRLQAVNRWSAEEAEIYAYWAERVCAYRSQFEWVLDLSGLADAPWSVKDGDGGWAMDDEGWLSRRGARAWGNRTKLLGVQFKVGGRSFEPVPPEPFYRSLSR